LISGSPTTLDEAMRHVIASVAGALSCEFGVLYLPAVDLIAFDDHTIHDVDISAIRTALDLLLLDINGMTCVQNAAEQPLPLPLPTDFGVRSWIAFPTSPSLGGLIVCAHTDRGPRGFTAMCQQLGRKLADSAELVLHAAVERERLLSEASTATVEARMDSLTGLLNRRGWDDAVRRSDADPERNFSVVVADLNDLKAVNDSLGHAAGDRLLRAAARCLSNLVRNDDVVARIGGDEFAILMRDTEDAVCRRLVAQLEALLEIERIATPELSVAAGFATNQGESAFETVRRADAAMYACKLRLKQARTVGTG
ncbi:MAG: GGDEF domain-containing protein, partial [Ilumatobacteraceae bacterium]